MTILTPSEIKIGSKWKRADGASQTVIVEGINQYGSVDPFYEIVYSWVENGIKKQSEKDCFSFQCHYVLIK